MHRTTPVPRHLCWGLLLSLLLPLAAPRGATAQPEPLPPPAAPGEAGPVGVLTVPVNTTKRVEMSSKEIIKEVRNENPKVVRVQSIVDDPRAVLVTGLSLGSSRLTFVDVNKKVEQLDVRVPDQSNIELETRRVKLLEMIKATVPNAVVDAQVTGPTSVVLSGKAPGPEKVQAILEVARGFMGGPQAQVVNNMDVGGVQQVQLEVVVALVNRTMLRQISFNWMTQGHRFFVNSIVGTASGSPLSTVSQFFTAPFAAPGQIATNSIVASTPNTNFGILGNNVSFLGFLEALKSESLAKVMADTRVLTLSGRPAILVSGGQTPLLTSSGFGAPSVSYMQFGTVVNFLPIVLSNGKIHLEVTTQLSDLNPAAGITVASAGIPTSVPGFSVRTAQTAVQMEDGQTLAIGGLNQTKVNATAVKVPILGEIPYVGVLFSAKQYKEEEEELLILVTPRLVDPICCTQIPPYLPGRETRSPDDFELFLEGILEAPRGPRYVNYAAHHQGAHMNSPNAGQYPCPGGGYLGLGCPGGQCGGPAPAGLAAPGGPTYLGLAAGVGATGTPGGLAPAEVSRSPLPAGPAAVPTGREPENRPVLPPPVTTGRE